MPSRTVANVRQTLRDEIKPKLPRRWKLVANLAAVEDLAVPALYFEFKEISNEQDGNVLAAGFVFCRFDLVIVTPRSDNDAASENRVDGAVLDLVVALDDSPIVWGPVVQKIRLDSGQLGWRVPLTVLTSSVPTTTEGA